MVPRLWTDVTQMGRAVVLKVRGELTATTRPGMWSLLHALTDGGEQRLVLDLSDATGDPGAIETVLGTGRDRIPIVHVLRG